MVILNLMHDIMLIFNTSIFGGVFDSEFEEE